MSDFHFSPRPNRANEIQWHEWDEKAFNEARETDRPILLSISAVWCHWCHVMDETTYSSQNVIDAINSQFVSIRVDNDRRPDVNARYNQGGWPTTAILTSDGELLKGATYVPPDQMHQLLSQITAFYSDADNRARIAEHMKELERRRAASRIARTGMLKPDTPDRIFSFLDASFDETYAGFGAEQKFPQTGALHFLLDLFARRRNERAMEMVQRTLHAMAEGGMYDHVEGGFYRYSTTRDYSVPHFEKMLEDLSGLLLACARAGALFDDAKLARISTEVRSYLDARLWNAASGTYGGSQDADEEYYSLDAAGRAARQAPYVDPTLYTSWNAEAARALIVGGPLLERAGASAAEWTARGLAVLETLWSAMLRDGLMCRYYDGTALVRGLLGDQAWSAWAGLAAFEATGESVWLDRVRSLVIAAESLFDTHAGGYADRPLGEREPGRLSELIVPFDENALMARVLMSLGALTGDSKLTSRARTLLEAGAETYRSYGSFAAAYGSAALDFLEPPLEVKIAGPASAAGTAALRDAARRSGTPARIITMDAVRDADRQTALGQAVSDGGPMAYVCSDRECFARTADADKLAEVLSHATAAS